jgi:hypothetical protein
MCEAIALRLIGAAPAPATPLERLRGEVNYLVGDEPAKWRTGLPCYALEGDRVSFDPGRYDPARPLVIDPVVLAYSTYLGGGDFDAGQAIAVDADGSAYVAGTTRSDDFNTVGAFQGLEGTSDAFVSNLTPAGSGLAYSTYLGDTSDDGAYGVAVDAQGAGYVAGTTSSNDFDTVGAIESHQGSADAFISKLVLDTTLPETTLDSTPPPTGTERRPTFDFSADEADVIFRCRIDAQPTTRCTSPFTTPELTVGSHRFRVRARDAAGNWDPTAALYAFRIRES